jgi:hypothetical protein
MAQNVKDILPEAVSYNTDKITKRKHFAIDYKAFIPLLIEAIKEIHNYNIRKDQIIEDLRDRIAHLENGIHANTGERNITSFERRIMQLEEDMVFIKKLI